MSRINVQSDTSSSLQNYSVSKSAINDTTKKRQRKKGEEIKIHCIKDTSSNNAVMNEASQS
jgi:hypothetical protein